MNKGPSPDGPSASILIAEATMSTATPMPTWERAAIYARNRKAPTPHQRRRIIHKDRHMRSAAARARIEKTFQRAIFQ